MSDNLDTPSRSSPRPPGAESGSTRATAKQKGENSEGAREFPVKVPKVLGVFWEFLGCWGVVFWGGGWWGLLGGVWLEGLGWVWGGRSPHTGGGANVSRKKQVLREMSTVKN